MDARIVCRKFNNNLRHMECREPADQGKLGTCSIYAVTTVIDDMLQLAYARIRPV